jgi:hypothetical protein
MVYRCCSHHERHCSHTFKMKQYYIHLGRDRARLSLIVTVSPHGQLVLPHSHDKEMVVLYPSDDTGEGSCHFPAADSSGDGQVTCDTHAFLSRTSKYTSRPEERKTLPSKVICTEVFEGQCSPGPKSTLM